MSAIEYLKNREWSMGNGQCPDCCGCPPRWLGHPCHLDSSAIGHKPDCELAAALSSVGGHPLMIGDFVSDKVFEYYITDSGFFSTRLETKDGCPKIKAMINEGFKPEENR